MTPERERRAVDRLDQMADINEVIIEPPRLALDLRERPFEAFAVEAELPGLAVAHDRKMLGKGAQVGVLDRVTHAAACWTALAAFARRALLGILGSAMTASSRHHGSLFAVHHEWTVLLRTGRALVCSARATAAEPPRSSMIFFTV